MLAISGKKSLCRQPVLELVELLKTMFRPELPEGADPRSFGEHYVVALGEDFDPRDIRSAAKILMRDRREVRFPLPAEVIEAVKLAAKRRVNHEEYVQFRLSVDYLDELQGRFFRIKTSSEAERDALSAALAKTDDPVERRRIATAALIKAGQKTPEDFDNGYRLPVKPSWDIQ
ncbi:hypothetical protein [Hyphomicrobium sp.]|uniref:hypothetical protein n=1 Tax=Hyphomicrobium sp. TaxID=82 RepID=UPI001DF60F37|nr:hypothetical protein [Hyphomicrobium sp.]MBY0561465.1 hypothetical protein [Hyphomicrobium sp.]